MLVYDNSESLGIQRNRLISFCKPDSYFIIDASAASGYFDC